MEDLGENTTVLSSLRSLNNFISQRMEGTSGLDVSTSASGSLQKQYEYHMQLEERAEQIRSKSYLIQVEREKMQMELSHKRARVELERAASTNARNYEREVDRNQELLARIRQLQECEATAEEKMREQLERHRLCKQNLDAVSQQLREQEDSLASAREMISSLKGRVSELQLSAMDQKVQVKRLESEKQELKEQLELQQRKWQEANQKIQELQASQDERAEHEQKIKDLEQKLCLQEQDAAVVKSMKSELMRMPRMERELKRLHEENTHLREMKETNGLLTEELEGLQRKLSRQEKMQEALVDLELEKEKLLAKLQSWENLDQTMGLNLRTPEDLSRFVVELQQRELTLKEKNNSITSSARGLEKVQQQLQDEVRQANAQLLEERKKRETHEALARRLQKRNALLTKAQLSQALEELGVQKQRADTLEMELKMLKAQTSSAESSFSFCKEEVDALRLKVEELEGERSRLEQEKQVLEMQMEKLTLQGDYNQSRTKVLHMSLNPISMARQRQHEDHDRLQEECERLRGLVHALERGGPIPADLEAASSLPSSKEVAELRKQVESAELKNQRLKEVFQTKIQEFRKVCYTLTGYQIDVTTESQYRLTSRYAEHQTDCLIFKGKNQLELQSSPSGLNLHLNAQHPGFSLEDALGLLHLTRSGKKQLRIQVLEWRSPGICSLL
ncbi:mitotic spindle assembly checkpoint protein MAD1 isoform X3 [Mus musculus]|uniref:mitotic spindle assembly checkpoint protein MAD1 isoform X3 n=1 Tax=Mus musculus TaxID=10090 RepID=UPI0016745168|nr:mitotic spindle assembly checkpoint protein MAD1 isoform X3 [Mus musculus]XP_036020735.1 mitotic spindle assembly checkpoint protein MAD1 isoform X3 [Mus musculus]